MADWKAALERSDLPHYMHGGISRYVEHGILPGDFLTAVLCNDLREACERADDVNRHLLWEYVAWFYSYAPGACWGSPERVKAWVEDHAKFRQAAEYDEPPPPEDPITA